MKIRKMILSIVLALIISAAYLFWQHSNGTYGDGRETVRQKVNLNLYEPFAEDSLVAKLPEPPEHRLSGKLPRLDGATALYPLYAAFVQALYPEENYKDYIACNGTAEAYERLITGEVDVIFAAWPSERQLELAGDRDVELQFIPIGKEAFVFFVNAKNPVNDISSADIRRIYSGEAVNWREFGWKSKPIRAFQRSEDSGSQSAMERLMGDTPLMKAPREDIAVGMGDMINEVADYRNYDNAIGYSFLYFTTEMVNNDKIKLLSIDGVAPTRENISNGNYPFTSDFYMVTSGELATDTDFNKLILLSFILSGEGQFLVEATGYTPY